MEEIKIVFDGMKVNEEEANPCEDECVGGTASQSNMEATN